MKIEEFIEKILYSRDQVHIFHLQTRSYAEHKALNKYYDGILDLFDSFIEKYMGSRNSRFIAKSIVLEFDDYDIFKVKKHFDEMKEFFTTTGRKCITDKDRDLHNIMDEMLGLVNETSYLLSLT